VGKFSLESVEELPLERAPLVKVLMQVQFSRTPQLITDAAEAAISEALGRYPVRRRQAGVGVFPNLAINGQPLQLPVPFNPGVALLFSDAKSAWQVTVTENSVGLETTEYSTREDFCERALEVFKVVARAAMPPIVDRVGMRYIDRLTGEAMGQVRSYVMPELTGLVNIVDPPLVLQRSITESMIELNAQEQLMVRSGLLPAGSSFDTALPALPEPAWLLDMDVYTTRAGFAFDPEALAERLRRYGDHVHSFFRYVTTEAFLDAHRESSSAEVR
jgi:uncharacterized protein (TIGR04255 family)